MYAFAMKKIVKYDVIIVKTTMQNRQLIRLNISVNMILASTFS